MYFVTFAVEKITPMSFPVDTGNEDIDVALFGVNDEYASELREFHTDCIT